MNRSSALLLAFALLSGCQSMAPVSTDGTPPVDDSTQAPEKPKVYGSFSEETIFSLLSAELAGLPNSFDIALVHYVTQAINNQDPGIRSEEHTPELQSLMRRSYDHTFMQKKTNSI